jgi:membrane protease YdiL (CAAX protease family)
MRRRRTEGFVRQQETRVSPVSTLVVMLVGIAALGIIEMLLAYVDVLLGLLLHAGLLVLLLVQYAQSKHAPYSRLLPALALLPLLRILSLTMPTSQAPQIVWYGAIGIPLLLAAGMTAALLGLSLASLGFVRTRILPQAAIALSGPVLGLGAYLIARPDPLVTGTGIEVVAAALVLATCTGLAEEFIFRGILQAVVQETFYRTGIFYVAALYAVMHIASLSWGYALFMGGVGLFFSWCVRRTQATWGVVLAHSALSITLFLVWPLASL